jgi:HEAT repeat protein
MKVVTKKDRPKRKAVKKKVSEIDDLLLELRSDDEQVVIGAVDRLGEVDDPKATGHLVACLVDTRQLVRLYAAVQLGERQDRSAVDSLIKALRDSSLFVRQTVAGALENIGGKKALKAVEQAEGDGLLLDELPEGIRLRQR